MRINIYSEEMTEEVVLVEKVVKQPTRITYEYVKFYGIRIFLKSPAEILEHSTPEDDDRNAVTFWYRADEAPTALTMFALAYAHAHSIEVERIAAMHIGPPITPTD